MVEVLSPWATKVKTRITIQEKNQQKSVDTKRTYREFAIEVEKNGIPSTSIFEYINDLGEPCKIEKSEENYQVFLSCSNGVENYLKCTIPRGVGPINVERDPTKPWKCTFCSAEGVAPTRNTCDVCDEVRSD